MIRLVSSQKFKNTQSSITQYLVDEYKFYMLRSSRKFKIYIEYLK